VANSRAELSGPRFLVRPVLRYGSPPRNYWRLCLILSLISSDPRLSAGFLSIAARRLSILSCRAGCYSPNSKNHSTASDDRSSIQVPSFQENLAFRRDRGAAVAGVPGILMQVPQSSGTNGHGNTKRARAAHEGLRRSQALDLSSLHGHGRLHRFIRPSMRHELVAISRLRPRRQGGSGSRRSAPPGESRPRSCSLPRPPPARSPRRAFKAPVEQAALTLAATVPKRTIREQSPKRGD
jgi:hypothetical protein